MEAVICVQISKSQTNADNPLNYRPISLLSVVSYVMERHIYSIVYEHLAEQELLSDVPLGFSPGKSTVTALVSLSYGKMVLISNLCFLTYIKLLIVSILKAKILD